MHLSGIIADIYDAGAGNQSWRELGERLFTYLRADSGSFRVPDGKGNSINLFATSSTGSELPDEDRFSRIVSIGTTLGSRKSGGDFSLAVATEAELVDARMDGQSEFFQDFVCRRGQDHMLVGAVEDCGTAVGFFRSGQAFEDDDKSALRALLPHLKRAIQLEKRLGQAREVEGVISFALDALPGSAFMVDDDFNILIANRSAHQMLADGQWPVSARSKAMSHPVGTQLVISGRQKLTQLKALVGSAARGGGGGALLLETDGPSEGSIGRLAVVVIPQAATVLSDLPMRVNKSLVLVLMQELSRPKALRPSLLSDLFGLSVAEGAVAQALMGGQTAERVAQDRNVSLETIRSQIRVVLRKTEAINLRDLERIGAMLSAMDR